METTAGPFLKWKNCRRVTSAAVAAEDPEARGAAAVPAAGETTTATFLKGKKCRKMISAAEDQEGEDAAGPAALAAAADGLFPDLLPIKTINLKGQINE